MNRAGYPPAGFLYKEETHMYEEISSFENLLEAYYQSRICKRYKASILQFGFFLESNLLKLHEELVSERYMPSPYVYFTINDPKERDIAAPAFRDRVVQHTLIDYIEPSFDKQFIYDSYACRKGKGTVVGLQRIKKFLQSARSVYGSQTPLYCLRMDISKFFANISWDVLSPVIFKTITCSKIRRLIEKIVTQHQRLNFSNIPFDTVSPLKRRGLPIGNLTSQLFANIYLNELDQFVKHTLRVRWYARYMDDFLIIHPDKNYLKNMENSMRTFLEDTLHLTLSERKVILSNVKNGVPFVGYRIFYDHILIRGKTLSRMQKKLRKRKKAFRYHALSASSHRSSRSSISGHLGHANSFHLRKKMALWR